MDNNPHEQILQLLITGGFLDPGKLKEARDIIGKCDPSGSLEDAEKEVMMQAFDKVYKMFQARSWIMEGRGSYRYDDDRYKEEVRFLYDEFDQLYKDTWSNIKSKSVDFRNAVFNKDSFLKELREWNPWEAALPAGSKEFSGWDKCCDKAEELLNQKEEK